ncbi:MAG: sensor histidine kinase [Bacteroidota bacterium]
MHLLYWGSFFLMYTLLASLNPGPLIYQIIYYLSLLPAQVLAAYTLVYYLYPKLFLGKKYVAFAISCLLAVYVFSALARICSIYVAEPVFRENFEQESLGDILGDPLYLFSVYFPGVYITAFLMLAIKVVKERFEEKHRLEVLEKEKIASELKFLKAQINPHFLFNTLNNLYALTLAKSDAAPLVVMKLSELLDYILHESSSNRIPLSKEVEMIKSYIELEKLRYGNALALGFTHAILQPDIPIAPMILLSMVENAFKHGVSPNPEGATVEINLVTDTDLLQFTVINSIPQLPNSYETPHKRNGLGSTNINRQLELNYPKMYTLDTKGDAHTYTLELTIVLS